MSIQKIKKLIDAGPEFAQYWEQNHKQIEADFAKKFTWCNSWLMVKTLSLMCLMVYLTMQMLPPIPVLSGLEALGLVLGMIFFLTATCWCSGKLEKWAMRWPRNTPEVLLEFSNANRFLKEDRNFVPSSTTEKRKEIAKIMLHHSNIEVRHYATKLLDLKDLNLPDVWWRALELALLDVPQHRQTSEQELESVYVEIENAAQQSQTTISNALKL